MTSTLGANTRQFVWDELSQYGDVVAELDGSGALLTSYVLGGGQLISQTQSGADSYYHPDALGSTRALSDSSGSVTDTYSYNAYGQIVAQTGATANNYLYAGQQYDSVTGLYSMRARYYDPGTGRFMSRDTWALNMENPVEWNRYGYTAGDPVNGRDPSGYTMISSVGILGNAIAVASILFTASAVIIGTLFISAFLPIFIRNILSWTSQYAHSSTISVPFPGSPEYDVPVPSNCVGNGNCERFLRQFLAGLFAISEVARYFVNMTIWVDGGAIPDPIPDPENIERFGGGRVGDIIKSKSYDILYNGISIAQPGGMDGPSFANDLFLQPAFHAYAEFSTAGGGMRKVIDSLNYLVPISIDEYHSNLSHNRNGIWMQGAAWRNCRSYKGITDANIVDATASLMAMISQARNPFRGPQNIPNGSLCPNESGITEVIL